MSINSVPIRNLSSVGCLSSELRDLGLIPGTAEIFISGTFSVTANQPGRQAARQPARADRGRAVTVREYACAGAWQPPGSQACHRHAGRVPVSWFVSTSSSSDLRTMTLRDPVRRLQS
uniref:Uncharacterized protein n=1 Tax=Timema poppense TaxID=170557 RepID=A0A7R9GWJ4_TIMPO|nr:unnamed protein product [Timema poppensis]